MRTDLPDGFLHTLAGQRANEILRSCVHCGFCNATCPTYQLLGNELDGPRGRIYLIKELFETGDGADVTARHLDRCLTCRACETTCPSGVQYGELAELARAQVEPEARRGVVERVMRWWFPRVLPYPRRLRFWGFLGRLAAPVLPRHLRAVLPGHGKRASMPAPDDAHENQVVVLGGCVQAASTPDTVRALATLLEQNGRRAVMVPREGCCGSLELHLGDVEAARGRARHNIDLLMPVLDQVEAVVSSASGCGVTIKEYPRLLAEDPRYAPLAERLAARVVDAAEYCANLAVQAASSYRVVAWHSPCTLQHGQRVAGALVEDLLQRAGYDLVPVADPHLCCGSAGTYSFLQRDLGARLRSQRLAALTRHEPDVIATANVGCQMHLQLDAPVPVVHWLELVKGDTTSA